MARVRMEIHNADDVHYRVDWIEPDGRSESGTVAKSAVRWQPPGAASGGGPRELAHYVASCDPGQRTTDDFQGIARNLFDWLLPAGAVRQRWNELHLADGFEIVLDVRVDELVQLPWELAQSPPPEGIRIGALSRLHQRAGVPQRASAWPLRILFVEGCTPEEALKLGVYEELRQIGRVFRALGRSVDLQVLARPTKQQFMDWVRENHPHVLHFAGHGGNVPGAIGSFLRFEHEIESWQWRTNQVVADLHAWRWFPSFVFLNACRSGKYAEASWSMQRAFMAAGARAVLAMQADVSGPLAGAFAAKVYGRCAQGFPIQHAVEEGRNMIGALSEYDHWLPVLAAAESQVVLFQPKPRPATAPFDECAEFEGVRCFVDCVEGRRALTNWFHPVVTPEPPAQVKHVAVIQGPPKSGKSHLVKWCMESWVLLGAEVRYVLVHGSHARTWLSILRQIRDGDAGGRGPQAELLHSALPEPEFRPFNWHLANYLEHGKSEPWDPALHGNTPLRDDNTRELTARGEQRLEEPIFGHFLAALRGVANAKPLVLVFDQLTDDHLERLLTVDDFKQLARYLVRPIMHAPQSNIKLVFVVNERPAKEFEIQGWPSDRVLLFAMKSKIDTEQLVNFATEITSPDLERDEKIVKAVATGLLAFPPEEGAATGLGALGDVYQAIRARHPSILERLARMQ